MPVIGKLSALKVAREKRPGDYGDGGGLYLQVTKQGSKSWIFRFWVAERDPKTGAVVRDPTTNKVRGRGREMGLGSCITVSLAEARDHALECRKLREKDKDIDPIDAREAARRQASLERAKSLNFRAAAATYIAAHRAAWKNDKHAGQWTATCLSAAWRCVGACNRYCPHYESDRANLGDEARDGEPYSRQDRIHPRLGHVAWLSAGRKPGALTRSPRQTAAVTYQSSQDPASQCAAL